MGKFLIDHTVIHNITIYRNLRDKMRIINLLEKTGWTAKLAVCIRVMCTTVTVYALFMLFLLYLRMLGRG